MVLVIAAAQTDPDAASWPPWLLLLLPTLALVVDLVNVTVFVRVTFSVTVSFAMLVVVSPTACAVTAFCPVASVATPF